MLRFSRRHCRILNFGAEHEKASAENGFSAHLFFFLVGEQKSLSYLFQPCEMFCFTFFILLGITPEEVME